MNGEIISAAAAVFGMVGGASIISGLVLRRIDRLERKLDSRERDRVREAILTGGCLSACEKLSAANTDTLRRWEDAGLCEAELSALRAAREKLNEFLLTKSAEYLHAR